MNFYVKTFWFCKNHIDWFQALYWEIVEKADDHVAVQGASLDTSIYGSMFPVRRDNPYARWAWCLYLKYSLSATKLHWTVHFDFSWYINKIYIIKVIIILWFWLVYYQNSFVSYFLCIAKIVTKIRISKYKTFVA